ncbi:MAG: hypothetical protein JW821_02825 [Deltaproteobacteria bacterium]|nr:hypothetical protein [Deltaproteobacteria bacterium]
MVVWPFKGEDIQTLSEALEISEDRTGNHFKFSFGQWKRHRYEVKTLMHLKKHEIVPETFACLNKCSIVPKEFEFRTKGRDFYRICLQDDQILKAVQRDRNTCLISLLVYVLTHELVHIVRFCSFNQRFDVRAEGRDREERIVHRTTYEILRDLSLPHMDHILESYSNHRACNVIQTTMM